MVVWKITKNNPDFVLLTKFVGLSCFIGCMKQVTLCFLQDNILISVEKSCYYPHNRQSSALNIS